MVRLSQEEFLSALARMYGAGGGSVTTSFKRYNEHKKGPNGGESSHAIGANAENTCLVKACKGSRKISTVVDKVKLAQFHKDFSNILKVRVASLVQEIGPSPGGPMSAPSSTKKVRKKSRR